MAPAQPTLPLSGLVLLSAPPKSGASTWALSLAHAVATGADFPGVPAAAPATALYVTYNGIPNVRLPFADRLYIANDLPTLDVNHWPVEIAVFAAIHRPALIVIDPLLDAIGRIDIDRRRSARRLMERLRRLASETGACILLVHHARADGHTPVCSAELSLGADTNLAARQVWPGGRVGLLLETVVSNLARNGPTVAGLSSKCVTRASDPAGPVSLGRLGLWT